MAKKIITFKDPGTRIVFQGYTVHPGNLTEEMYNALVAAAESHKELFNVVEETTGEEGEIPGEG